MSTYRDWLENQARIYDEIRELGRTTTQFIPDIVADVHRSGYLVAYVFPDDIEQNVASIADWYSHRLPVMGFGPGSAHSTILIFRNQAGGIDFAAEESQKIFRQLAEGVRQGIAEVDSTGIAILYDEILHRETTVVARGVPNQALWNLSEAIYNHCRKAREVRRGWGSHITIARVTEPRELAEPLKAPPFALGEARPKAIIVGTMDMREKQIRRYERFELT